MIEKLVIFDTDCLSCFLTVDITNILKKTFKQIIIPQQVYDEFNIRPVLHLKKKIDELIDEEFIFKEEIKIGTSEYQNYKNLINEKLMDDSNSSPIGKGEAAALILAKKYNGIIASNNSRDVLKWVEVYNLNWIKTGDILLNAIENGIITENEAINIWKEMLKRGRYLQPINFKEFKPTMEYYGLK